MTTDLDGAMVLVGKLTIRCEEQRVQLDGQRAANVALAKELAAALEQAEAYRQALLEVTSARDELVRERRACPEDIIDDDLINLGVILQAQKYAANLLQNMIDTKETE